MNIDTSKEEINHEQHETDTNNDIENTLNSSKLFNSTVNNNDDLETFEPEITEETEKIVIKDPNQVYREIFKKAKNKARQLKNSAIQAILEANNIKNTYMLNDSDDSDSESDVSNFEEEEYS